MAALPTHGLASGRSSDGGTAGPWLRPGPWGGAQSAGGWDVPEGTRHPCWADKARGLEGPGSCCHERLARLGLCPGEPCKPW